MSLEPDPNAIGMTAEELQAFRESITPEEAGQIAGVLDGLRRWITVDMNPSSDIVTPQFAHAFGLQLKIFHALSDRGQFLSKKPFEWAFKRAIEADGDRHATITEDSTFPGRDLILDDALSVSLKTEAARNIRPDRITISKLMESAWTKDCGSVDDFLASVSRITAHLRSYDRLFVLRVFGRLDQTGSVRYDLVEIPVGLLLAAEHLTTADFGAITRAGGTTARVRVEGTELYRLVFDGSDQKITVRNIQVDRCIVHGSWTLT